MLKHPHIVGTKWELRGRDAGWKRTLIVQTNLNLDPDNAEYSATAENELLTALDEFWRTNPSVYSIDIESIRIE